jgi:hypothetical protein
MWVADDRHTFGMHLGTGEREGRRFEDLLQVLQLPEATLGTQ